MRDHFFQMTRLNRFERKTFKRVKIAQGTWMVSQVK